MSVREDLAAAYAEVFDAKRDVLVGEDASLVLVLNAGTAEESEVTVEGGWTTERQQKFGEVNSIRLIKITARASLTAEVMSQADRLKLNGVLHQFNYDPPVEDVWWTLYAEELKTGGMR